ncbi:MAG: hypothetical protein ACK5KN_11850 [Dysgonomonas sp.]|uniref:hypothetical protein n=1 Tax=Dysgonomonas sp. TaxID=1891233 RepID=UPI003A886CB6
MKKILSTALFLSLYLSLFAQDTNGILKKESFLQQTQSLDSLQAISMSDKVFNLLNKSCKQEIKEAIHSKYTINYYCSDGETPAGYMFQYDIVKDGANRDLEIKGQTVYKLHRIFGKYLDLYTIWSYMLSECGIQAEDKTTLVNNRNIVYFIEHNDGNTYIYTFNKGRTNWNIEIRKSYR